MDRRIAILKGETQHELLRCPACDTLSLEFVKNEHGMAIMCSNRNCGMTGPHRKRTVAAVRAWNTLPRKVA